MKPAAKPPQPAAILAGRPWPLGVEWVQAEDAFNFALYSRHATGATLYAYRLEGPHDPECGHGFDPQKVLLDPYAPSVFFPPQFSRKTNAPTSITEGAERTN